MNRRRVVRPPHPAEQGFLIIGVVVFVLALTIIGLSLFSLSSFEAQFLGRSTHSAQAFYAATGGIERAMNVLDDSDSLEAVTLDLPLEHVIYARARYWNAVDADWESTGAVPWNAPTPVEIRVVAEVQGVRRAVEATYRAQKSNDIYSNLVTTPTKLIVRTTSASPLPAYSDAHLRTHLAGKVVQGIDDDTGVGVAQTAFPFPAAQYEHVSLTPAPDAMPFIDAHDGVAEPVFSGPSDYMFMAPLLAPAGFFEGGTSVASPSTETGFGFRVDVNEIRLLVTGRAIWLLPGGGYFGGHVQVIGTPGLSTLVIVATQGTNPKVRDAFPPLPLAGLWFEGGITSTIPVILVSDGTVAIEHFVEDKTTHLDYVSIFAGGVLLKAPRDGNYLRLTHPPTAFQVPLLTDLEILPPLLENQLLPNSPVGGGRATFTLEPGTWREVTESNPS